MSAAQGAYWRWWVFGLVALGMLVHYAVQAGRRDETQREAPPPATAAEKACVGFLVTGIAWAVVFAWSCVSAMASEVFWQGIAEDLAGETWLITMFLFVAVWVPCCTSDIVFPLLFSKERTESVVREGSCGQGN